MNGKITAVDDGIVKILYPDGVIEEFSILEKKVLLAIIKSISAGIYEEEVIKKLDLFLLSQREFNSVKQHTQLTELYMKSYIDFALSKIDINSLKGKLEEAVEIAKDLYIKIHHTRYKYYFVNNLKKSFQYYKISIFPLKDRLIINVHK